MRKILLSIGAVAFAALFFFAGTKVLGWYMDSRQSQAEFEQVSQLIGTQASSAEFSGAADEMVTTGAEDEPVILTILEEYAALCEQNPDFVGWITIEGTRIDYPVMQSVNDPDFYLKHNFEKNYSSYGVPYIQADCDLLKSDNLIIYGHRMNDGSMFSDLNKYTDAAFYAEHKIIQFNTKYSYGSYEIIAAFKTTGGDNGFPYHRFVDAEDAQAFDEFVAACKEMSFYEIDATAQYGDRLITLSTCEYSQTNGRMVVVAKLISETTE